MLIIGVEDKTWEVIGVKNVSETIDGLLQSARLCKPIVRFDPPQPQVVEIDGRPLVIAHVPSNDGTLYQTGGVCWTRRGTHIVPLEVSEIEAFLYHRGTLAWEAQPVLRAKLQDLDMTIVEDFLEKRPSRSKNSGRLSRLDEILLNIGCAVIEEDERKQPSRRVYGARR